MKFQLEIRIGEDVNTTEDLANVLHELSEVVHGFSRAIGRPHDLSKPMCQCGQCEDKRLFIAEMQSNTTGLVDIRMKVVHEEIDSQPEVKSTDPGFVLDAGADVMHYRDAGEQAEVLQ